MSKKSSGTKSVPLAPEIAAALTELTVAIKTTLSPLFDEKKCLEPVSKTHDQEYLKEANKRLKSASQGLSHTCAAFVFAFTDPLDTSACVSAVETLRTAVFELSNVTLEIIGGVSRPMRKILTKQLHSVCESVCNFLMHVARGPECRGEAAAPISGIVLQYCVNLGAVDLCDPKIPRNEALLWMENVKDAIAELNEIKAAGEDDNEMDAEENEDDYFGKEEKLTAEELAIRGPVVLMSKAGGVAISTAAKVIRLNACATDQILDSCQEVSTAVDELCCCVYPPQDRKGLAAAAEKTNAAIIRLQENTLNEIKEDTSQDSENARKMFAAVVDKSKSLLEHIHKECQN